MWRDFWILWSEAPPMEKFLYTCKACGNTDMTTKEEAYQSGWGCPLDMCEHGNAVLKNGTRT